MNKTASTLLTAAIVTGLLSAQAVKAETNPTATADQPTAEKNSCKGKKAEKNSCKGAKEEKKKKDKNSCKGKNGCGQKDEKAEGK